MEMLVTGMAVMFVANAVLTLINVKLFTEYVKDKLQDKRKGGRNVRDEEKI